MIEEIDKIEGATELQVQASKYPVGSWGKNLQGLGKKMYKID